LIGVVNVFVVPKTRENISPTHCTLSAGLLQKTQRKQTKVRQELKNTMEKRDCDSAIEFARLIRANVSGPIQREVIAAAQKRLVRKLRLNGVLSPAEAEELSFS